MAEHGEAREQWLPARLLRCLEDCTEKELKRFKWHLCQRLRDCWEPVPRGRLEKLDEMDVVDAMVEAYTVEGALEITLHILRRMDLNELAFRLWRDALCPSTEHKPTLTAEAEEADQQELAEDCSSDSEHSVYWDAEEGDPDSHPAQDQSLAVGFEEGGAASRTSFFGKQEAIQAAPITSLAAGLHKEDAVSEQHENGCSALRLCEDPVERGVPPEKGPSVGHKNEHAAAAIKLLGDPEVQDVTSETSFFGEQEVGVAASILRPPGDTENQDVPSDSNLSGKHEEGNNNSDRSPLDEAVSCQSERVLSSAEPKNLLEVLTLELTFKMLCKTLEQLLQRELERFKNRLIKDYPELFDSSLEEKHALDVVKMLLEGTSRSDSLNITLQVLRSIDQEALANSLEREKENAIRKFQNELFFKLKREFKRIF
ncbi:uncharacterized protein LOC108931237 [Scleropages formosus]|uniref:uncharacterized protein LOC108931237 n=1 Tax=Scleropages formosus TaxID=113540 RepID=UPI000879003E|nr:uncharacterized protein LOC108931237 [Scleropages formosus]XP_018602412.1 uncharacterized protein LOC108931237 [Scleropages formosus]